MSAMTGGERVVRVIDSHTAGEPTRVVVEGGPELGHGGMAERLQHLRKHFDGFRSGVVCEPRGSEVVVGALLLTPQNPQASAGVIFFNDVGYLGMCGHGTIGLITTLAHLRRIGPGLHRVETPVGDVEACLHDDGSVTVSNVASYRFRAGVRVTVPQVGAVTGDIAWGGNWFFLVADHGLELRAENRAELLRVTAAIRDALPRQGITGADGAVIDHIELLGPAADAQNSARNFVLCPGASFDRSPCGTGTSAKLACLAAEGALRPRAVWRQEGVLGTVFEGFYDEAPDGMVRPHIRGRAWVTAEAQLVFREDDPFQRGIRW